MDQRNPRDLETNGSDEDVEAHHGRRQIIHKAMGEEAFVDTAVPPWTKQITVRSMVTSLVLSVVFNFIVCKLNLTTGVIPSLNVAAGLLGFAVVKGYTAVLDKAGLLKQPFTRQENTVIQTCVVASSGIAFSSGTASYLLGMSANIAAQGEEGNTPINVKQLSLGWMIGYLFVVSFVGLFSIVPLRKMMIMKYKLTYPSGTATAYLINSFHTPKGAKLAKFYYDFSMTYVGVGMICPYMVNISLLIGAVLSWGIMWPLIEQKKGDWYSAELSPSSLHGIQGYRVFIAIAMMLGDGIFHVAYMLCKTGYSLVKHQLNKKSLESPSSTNSDISSTTSTPSSPCASPAARALLENYDEKRRTDYFLKDQIPTWAAIIGYITLAILSTITVPFIFPQLIWHHVLVAYLMAPVLAFCNAYGCGLTDWSLASNYGKFAIILFSAWVGLDNGGIVAGLASCGVMMSIVSTASDLMQDFKTGYLTLSSPRAMFFSQVIGTAIGCLVSPLVFWFFYKAYNVGEPGSSYPAPYGLMYRGIALLGVEGLSSFPKNCFSLCIAFFAFAVALNLARELLQRFETKHKIYRFVPSAMCMAIPFYLGGYFAIDMCLGSFILFAWRRLNQRKADELAPAVASGLICGESLWGIPAAILSLAGVNAPICMKFLSASVNNKVDGFLNG
ncbi:putative metal-nicotianamine transporter YSL7 [Morus notabilis]|uniref:Putative metal-nicotianamine transporter YSL7 n=1 Tax=Morus notabilis TaxID=981085 RepID=W9SPF9_9ROSA|nr:putative metal-nicotianamine transporter YSL7 [Morus notabilis]